MFSLDFTVGSLDIREGLCLDRCCIHFPLDLKSRGYPALDKTMTSILCFQMGNMFHILLPPAQLSTKGKDARKIIFTKRAELQPRDATCCNIDVAVNELS